MGRIHDRVARTVGVDADERTRGSPDGSEFSATSSTKMLPFEASARSIASPSDC
jgi:hypothetical protein